MDASTTISLIAVLISLLFGIYNVLAIRHERQDRRHELELYQDELQSKAQDREVQKRSSLHLRGHETSSSGTYELTLRNLGPSWAKDIYVCFTRPESKKDPMLMYPDKRGCAGLFSLGLLAFGEEMSFTFEPHDDARSSEWLIELSWADEAGSHKNEMRCCITSHGIHDHADVDQIAAEWANGQRARLQRSLDPPAGTSS
jgi:hypothetical protein